MPRKEGRCLTAVRRSSFVVRRCRCRCRCRCRRRRRSVHRSSFVIASPFVVRRPSSVAHRPPPPSLCSSSFVCSCIVLFVVVVVVVVTVDIAVVLLFTVLSFVGLSLGRSVVRSLSSPSLLFTVPCLFGRRFVVRLLVVASISRRRRRNAVLFVNTDACHSL